MTFQDALKMAIDRSDSYFDLWSLYMTIVGAAFVAAGAMANYKSNKGVRVALSFLFLGASGANLTTLYKIAQQREAFADLALSIGSIDTRSYAAVNSIRSGVTSPILIHIAADIIIAVLLYIASAPRDEVGNGEEMSKK